VDSTSANTSLLQEVRWAQEACFWRDDEYEKQLIKDNCVLLPNDNQYGSYTIDLPGKVYIYDKDSNQVVLAIKCTPVTELTNEEIKNFQEVFIHLHKDSQLHNECTSNGPQATGSMWAMGWRPGYEQGQQFNTYFYPKQGNKSKQWAELRDADYMTHTLYGQRFFNMAPKFFNTTKFAAHDNQIPLWGYQTYTQTSDLNDFCFAANLTHTKTKKSMNETFSNRPHKDKDGSPYTFGIWGIMDIEGNLIGNKQRAMQNGFFYIAPYKIKVDFEIQTDCIWEIIWRGKTDTHATVIGKMETGYQWLGSSAQTSKSLVERVHKYHELQHM